MIKLKQSIGQESFYGKNKSMMLISMSLKMNLSEKCKEKLLTLQNQNVMSSH